MVKLIYRNQHIDVEIPYTSRHHFIVEDTVKITFNLDIESTSKTRSLMNNAGKASETKNCL